MDHTKLTVPQLKAICKEKGLTGYSKLNRQALLDKLSSRNAKASFNVAPAEKALSSTITTKAQPSSTTEPCRSSELLAAGAASGAAHNGPGRSSLKMTSCGVLNDAAQAHTSSAPRNTTGPHSRQRASPPRGTAHGHEPAKTQSTSNGSVAIPPLATAYHTASKMPIAARPDPSPSRLHVAASPTVSKENIFKVPPVPFTTSSPATSQIDVPKAASSKRTHDAAFSVAPARPFARPSALAPVSSSSTSRLGERTPGSHSGAAAVAQSKDRPGKRFKPLTISRAAATSTAVPQAVQQKPQTAAAVAQPQSTSAHLDFRPVSNLPLLRTITLPPSLSQRKVVPRWAIILSGLADRERRVCARVSRMFRYAAYLSAIEILSREYAGRRLEQARTLHSTPTINWWPYLREREREKLERLHAYGTSFLASFYGYCPVSERLISSPDNPKQLTVALRFLQTRLWFTLSIGALASAGSDPFAWLRSTVVDAQEVAPSEIWQITASTGESFYVLEATCEVIGHPPSGVSAAPAMRADWMDYTADQGNGRPLLQRMRWAHNEEYERGLSRHWVTRTKAMGEMGNALRTVGERYTFACVVSNSVSGAWMSTSEMAQELSGPLQPIQTTKSSTKQSLGLFLPAHHHVESVHFTATGGQPLHPALAIIQTPAREYFILRDNGMQVGCEEDGVVEMWRKMLGCDAHGISVKGGERITLAALASSQK